MATATSSTRGERPSLSMVGLLVIEIIIGYEWLVSGLVKVLRGGFPAGLGEELLEKSEGTAAWYRSFLEAVVIPNASPFGYAIEISEVLAGVVLIGGPLVFLFAWERISRRARSTVLLATVVAAVGATILAVNLHFANGASHPWLLPGDAFDEGIDLDSVLPAIQIVIATVSIVLLRRVRRATADEVISPRA